MLKRCEQIKSEPFFFLANRIEIAALQQQSKKPLCEIFRLFRSNALSSYETINRTPIRAAKSLEFFLCRRRLPLCLQHHAPVRSSKRRAAMSSVDRGPRSHLIFSRGHVSNPSKKSATNQALSVQSFKGSYRRRHLHWRDDGIL